MIYIYNIYIERERKRYIYYINALLIKRCFATYVELEQAT